MPAEKNPLKAKRWPPIRPALRSFRTGRAVATPGVLETVPRTELFAALERHKRCDWGGVSEADWKANDRALKNGERLLISKSQKREIIQAYANYIFDYVNGGTIS